MSDLVQWPRAKYWDKPWNPIIGCRPASPACENCYARALVTGRFNTTGICAPGFEPTRTKRVNPPNSGVVFCGNMTDLFGEWVHPSEATGHIAKAAFFNATANLWLTKRAGRMADVLNAYLPYIRKMRERLSTHYFGFTAENQKWYDKRRDAVYHEWPTWANGWLSLEPLLGPIDDLKTGNILPCDCLKWVVVGCESGPHRRPCKIEWVESIVDECRAFGIPVFVKQLDIGGKCVTDIDKFPKHLRIRQIPWKQENPAK